MWQYNYSPELYHYGVMGMKWGHRKQEYKDLRNKYKDKINNAYGVYAKENRNSRGAGNRKQKLASRMAAANKFNTSVMKAQNTYDRQKTILKTKDKSAYDRQKAMYKYKKRAAGREFDAIVQNKTNDMRVKNGKKFWAAAMMSPMGAQGLASAEVMGASKKGAAVVTAIVGGVSRYYYNRSKYIKNKVG